MATSSKQKIWIGVRFVLFGMGGFWLMMLFFLNFMERVFDHDRGIVPVSPIISAVLAVGAAGLMLFGAGEWGKWAYLSVFLSIPVTFGAVVALPQNVTDRLSLPAFGLVLALVALAAYWLSRQYYRWRSNREPKKP